MAPRLLYVLHNYHNRAGTEEHTKMLAHGLQGRYDISLVFPQDGKLILRENRSGNVKKNREENREEIVYPAEPPIWPNAPYHSPQTESSLRAILERVCPDIIHVQHTFNWPLVALDILTASGAKTVMSFHDYFVITPFFTMQGITDPHLAFSKEYSQRIFGGDITPYLLERKKFVARSLDRIGTFVVPSNYLAKILNQIYPHKYRVIEHGIPDFKRPPRYDGPFRFGYVGSLLPQKGWRSLVQAYPALRARHPSAELHIFGGGEHYVGPAIPGVQFRGVYDRGDLPRICGEITVGVIPSVFAETFCLVLSELWLGGVPVCASGTGELGDRIIEGKNGKKFTPGDSESIARVLSSYLEDDEWRNWPIPKVRLCGEMVAEYDALYRTLLES